MDAVHSFTFKLQLSEDELLHLNVHRMGSKQMGFSAERRFQPEGGLHCTQKIMNVLSHRPCLQPIFHDKENIFL